MFPSTDRARRAHALLVSNCFYPLVLGSLLSVAFLATRYGFTGSTRYRFLVWNLFLAWLPYGCAIALAYLRTRTAPPPREVRPVAASTLLAVAWLLTFPNAPYILTDVVHLMNGRPVFRWWFDAGLVLSFALTGCFLGVASLRILHEMVRDRAGALVGWVFVLTVATLSGFGVYLGRFLRFNSWDVLTEPLRVARAIAVRVLDPLSYPRTYGVTLMFAALLLACYAVFVSASRPRQADASAG
jgi:uncharacterized membrane protein